MRPKSIGLGQMGSSMYGERRENPLETEVYRKLSSLGEEILWCGAVWGEMEWETWQRLRGG